MAFETIAMCPIPHLKGVGTVLRHLTSGAEVVAIQNANPELVFGAILETIPDCSNGVAHVLEHLIFRGSKRFPETHLYAKLVQGTLLTGLNASTGADSTLFHLSSTDTRDFANLIDILTDAIFHPLLREQDFVEERNIVANEMAGHYAMPSNQILKRLRQELLPETVYASDSGGDPRLIAALTHAELKDFHTKNYRPDRAQFFLWGGLDLSARLEHLDQLFEATATRNPVVRAPTLLRPPTQKDVRVFTPPNGPTMTGFGWAFEAKKRDLWQAISIALLAKPDGPLTQALSDFGGRIIGPGFSSGALWGTFEFAVLDHSESEQSNLSHAMERALRSFAQDCSMGQRVQSAVEQHIFNLRCYGSRAVGPTGLRALNMIRREWRHGEDPLALLDVDARAEHLQEIVMRGPHSASQEIATHLLENRHRVVVATQPDKENPDTLGAKTAPRTASDPSSAAKTSPLPFVPPEHLKLGRSSIRYEAEGNILHVPDPKPDISRAELAISLSGLTQAQLDSVLLLESVLADRFPTDGMHVSTRLGVSRHAGKSDSAWLTISGRSMPEKGVKMLRAICGVLRFPDMPADDLKGQVRQKVIALNARIAGLGHQFCETRLRAGGSLAGTLIERLSGLHSLHILEKKIELSAEVLLKDVKDLRKYLAENAEMVLAIKGIPTAAAQDLIQNKHGVATKAIDRLDLPAFQNIETGAANFTTGQAVPLSDAGPAHVAAHMLETGWLWDSIRVAGGAYSVRCSHNGEDQLLTMLSIRDPSPRRTLDHFIQAPVWLENVAGTDILPRCIAAKMGQLTRPVRPDDILSALLQRHLSGRTETMRQSELDHIRHVDAKAMRQLAQCLEAAAEQAVTVILGPYGGFNKID